LRRHPGRQLSASTEGSCSRSHSACRAALTGSTSGADYGRRSFECLFGFKSDPWRLTEVADGSRRARRRGQLRGGGASSGRRRRRFGGRMDGDAGGLDLAGWAALARGGRAGDERPPVQARLSPGGNPSGAAAVTVRSWAGTKRPLHTPLEDQIASVGARSHDQLAQTAVMRPTHGGGQLPPRRPGP
jgi:hypothetical protein